MRIHSDNPKHGFQFPGLFDITAMGPVTAKLEEDIPRLLAASGILVVDGSLSVRASRGGNYVSIKVQFHARDRIQYETAHQVLREHPEIKWIL